MNTPLLQTILKYVVLPQELPKKREAQKPEGKLEKKTQEKEETASTKHDIGSLLEQLAEEQGLEFSKTVTETQESYRLQGFTSKTEYAVHLEYTANEEEEELTLTVKPLPGYELPVELRKEAENGVYKASIKRQKEPGEVLKPTHITYTQQEGKEEVNITYQSAPETKDYVQQLQEMKEDCRDKVKLKHLDIIPKGAMGSVLGFTYIGEDYMARRDDLIGELKTEVDIHESIHTPDEYETRVLTWWIMEPPKLQYHR